MIVCGLPGSVCARCPAQHQRACWARRALDDLVDLVEGRHRGGAGRGGEDQERRRRSGGACRRRGAPCRRRALRRSSGRGSALSRSGQARRTPRARAGSGRATRSTPTPRARGGRRPTGPNSTPGTPASRKRDRVGGAVAAHGDAAPCAAHVGDRLARAPGRTGSSRSTTIGSRWKTLIDLGVGQVARSRRGSRPGPGPAGSGCRRRSRSASGTLLSASPPRIAAEVDRRAVEQVRRLARERQRLDLRGRRRSPSARRCRPATASSRGRSGR